MRLTGSRKDLVIRACKPEELPSVIRCLDEEFVYSKGRSLSLASRFPSILCPGNEEHIRLAVSEDVVCGAYVVRLFDWHADGRDWKGAMLGMVWVDPAQRRQGIGQRLLNSMPQFLREKGTEFAVLWTGTHAFYERAGWRLSDRGLFGTIAGRADWPRDDEVVCRELAAVEPGWLEGVRSRFLSQRVLRKPSDYRALPIPATQRTCFSSHSTSDGDGFALVGEQNGAGYFYEMAATESQWSGLWNAIRVRYDHLFVNGCLDDPFSQWLADQGHIVWHAQNKTMWLPLSHGIDAAAVSRWHIPYFDWI